MISESISDILVDDEDLHYLLAYSWTLRRGGNARKQKRGKVYVRAIKKIDGKIKEFFLHRLVIAAKSGEIVDHINGNTLDNRKCNLRIVTAFQNAYNRQVYSRNKLKTKGVWEVPNQKKPFRSAIQFNKKRIYLGVFATKQEAEEAYAAASLKYHGEYGVNSNSQKVV